MLGIGAFLVSHATIMFMLHTRAIKCCTRAFVCLPISFHTYFLFGFCVSMLFFPNVLKF